MSDSERAREEGLVAAGWLKQGHHLLGTRLQRTFDGRAHSAIITRWLPADATDGALFHAVRTEIAIYMVSRRGLHSISARFT